MRMSRSIDMGSSMCEERRRESASAEAERKEAGALRVVLLCHQGVDASDRLLWLLRLLLLLLFLSVAFTLDVGM